MGLIHSTCAWRRVSSVCARSRSVTSVVSNCDVMNCSPPGSSVGGTFQARVVGWAAFPPPGDLPDQGTEPTYPAAPALAGRFFFFFFFTTTEPPGKCKLSVGDPLKLPGAVTASKQAKHSGMGWSKRIHGHLQGPSFKQRLASSLSTHSVTVIPCWKKLLPQNSQVAEFLRPGPSRFIAGPLSISEPHVTWPSGLFGFESFLPSHLCRPSSGSLDLPPTVSGTPPSI